MKKVAIAFAAHCHNVNVLLSNSTPSLSTTHAVEGYAAYQLYTLYGHVTLT